MGRNIDLLCMYQRDTAVVLWPAAVSSWGTEQRWGGEDLEILHGLSQHSQTLWVIKPLKPSTFSPKSRALLWFLSYLSFFSFSFFLNHSRDVPARRRPPSLRCQGSCAGRRSQAASRTSAQRALLTASHPLADRRLHYGGLGYCYFTWCTSTWKGQP